MVGSFLGIGDTYIELFLNHPRFSTLLEKRAITFRAVVKGYSGCEEVERN